MSLRQELAVDRRYVATRYEEPQGYQTLQDAAEDIIRMKLAPLFATIHFRSAFRTADRLKMSVHFANDHMYTIIPTPIWEQEHTPPANRPEKVPCVQVYYSEYFDACNRDQLWEEVVRLQPKTSGKSRERLTRERRRRLSSSTSPEAKSPKRQTLVCIAHWGSCYKIDFM